MFDNRFVLQELLPEWELVCGSAGSGFGVWSADLRNKSDPTEWLRLRDSARLMPDALDKIGKTFELEKWTEKQPVHNPLDPDYAWLTQPGCAPDRERIGEEWDAGRVHEVVDYCFRDCDALLVALLYFRTVWRSLGVEPRSTIASTATAVVRRSTIPCDAWGWEWLHDKGIESVYHGGRTERFRGELGEGRAYDVVSSYPAAMLDALPTRVLRDGCYPWEPGNRPLAVVQATVRVARETDIPCLPYRVRSGALAGTLAFPTGEWTGLFTSEELACALETGACEVLKTHRVVEYASEPWMRDFIEYWAKIKTSPESSAALKYIAKLAMNSSYGKTCENPEHEELTSDKWKKLAYQEKGFLEECTRTATRKRARSFVDVATTTGRATIYGLTSVRSGAFRHIAAGAFITARGRIRVYKGILEAQKTGRVAYCDTDSVFTEGRLSTGDRLGEWSLDKEFDRAEFLRSKLYALWMKAGAIKVRCKGLRPPKDPHPMELEALWFKLKSHSPFEFESSEGFLSALRSRSIVYRRVVLSRTPKARLDKRAPLPDGGTRPWSVTEIEGLRHARSERFD